MASSGGREPRQADGAVLVIGLLGMVLLCLMGGLFAGWYGLLAISPLAGMLLLFTVALS